LITNKSWAIGAIMVTGMNKAWSGLLC